MNFSSEIKEISGGSIPNGSVALLYSPSCSYCHQIVPEFNRVPSVLSAGNVHADVYAINVQENFHALRAGGITIGGVPQVIIKTLSGGIIEYQGPRMAENIAQETAAVLTAGENPDMKLLSGGAEDALLGGVAPAVPAAAPLEAGKKRRSRRRSRSRRMGGGDLEAGKKRRSRRSRRSRRRMGGGDEVVGGAAPADATIAGGALEAGKRRRSRRSRSRRSRMRGGEAPVDAPIAGGELEAGKKRRSRRSRRSRRRMGGGEVVEGSAPVDVPIAGGELEAGKKRRSRRSRRSRRRMGGGAAPADAPIAGGAAEVVPELEAGRSKTRWQKLVDQVYKSGKSKGMSYKSAMKRAKSLYRRS